MLIDDVFEVYGTVFLPLYSEVVARRLAKPRQVATEIENCFSHLYTAHILAGDQSLRDENVKKAYGHIQRAILDCQKILWTTLLERAYYLDAENLISLASNRPLEEVLLQWQKVIKFAKDSRAVDVNNAGADFPGKIKFYAEAIEHFKLLDDMIDPAKVAKFRGALEKKETGKFAFSQFVGFLLGVVAGVVGNYAFKSLGG